MENEKRLRLNEAVTAAEIYAVKEVQKELKRQGISEKSFEGRDAIARAGEALAAHREEVRDMYRKSKKLLANWIVQQAHIGDTVAFVTMKWLGFNGNVKHDMECLKDRKDMVDAIIAGEKYKQQKGGRR